VIRLEGELAHVVRTIDSIAGKGEQWIGHGLTVVVAFVVSQFGGWVHLPR
jgi:hypothetical protein